MDQVRTGRTGIWVLAFATVIAAILLIAPAPGAMAPARRTRRGSSIRHVSPQRIHAGQDYGWLREHLKDAKGVLIYPQVLKAGTSLAARAAPASSWRETARRGSGAIRVLHAGISELRSSDRR